MKALRQQGFTLIELLIAVTIIVLLSSVAVVSYQAANKTARDGKRRADLEQIRSALEIYRTDCGSYPDAVSFGGQLVGTGICAGNTYMENVPLDPKNPERVYGYTRITNNTYRLCTSLENPPGSSPCNVANCGNICGSGISCNYSVCNP